MEYSPPRKQIPVPLICICVLIVLLLVPSNDAGNVLITASLGEGSHYFVGKTIGKYLAKQGHNVSVLLSEAYAHRAENPDDSELDFIIFHQTSAAIESVKERHLIYSKVSLNNVCQYCGKSPLRPSCTEREFSPLT